MMLRGVVLVLEVIAAILLLVLMAITGIDVIGRYLFDAPLPGAFEMTELLLGALVFAALPLVGREGGHIEVDLFVSFMPKPVLRALGIFAAVLSAAVLIFFAIQLWELGGHQWAENARSISLSIPFAPFAFLGAAACLLAALYAVLRERRG